MGTEVGPQEDKSKSISKGRHYRILLKNPLSSRPHLFPQIPSPSADPVSQVTLRCPFAPIPLVVLTNVTSVVVLQQFHTKWTHNTEFSDLLKVLAQLEAE